MKVMVFNLVTKAVKLSNQKLYKYKFWTKCLTFFLNSNPSSFFNKHIKSRLNLLYTKIIYRQAKIVKTLDHIVLLFVENALFIFYTTIFKTYNKFNFVKYYKVVLHNLEKLNLVYKIEYSDCKLLYRSEKTKALI